MDLLLYKGFIGISGRIILLTEVIFCFSVIAFRKANKVGFYVKVKPQVKDGDIQVILQY